MYDALRFIQNEDRKNGRRISIKRIYMRMCQRAERSDRGEVHWIEEMG